MHKGHTACDTIARRLVIRWRRQPQRCTAHGGDHDERDELLGSKYWVGQRKLSLGIGMGENRCHPLDGRW